MSQFLNPLKEISISYPWSLAFSNDSKYIIIGLGYNDSGIHVYETQFFKFVCFLKGHSNHVNDVKFSNDDKIIASVSVDSSVRIWDSKTF